MQRCVGMAASLGILVMSIAPAAAEANFQRVQDMHMMALIHSHCDLGFDDERASKLAQTYSQQEGGVSEEETAAAIAKAEALVSDTIRLKQKEQLCLLGKAARGSIGSKWVAFAEGR